MLGRLIRAVQTGKVLELTPAGLGLPALHIALLTGHHDQQRRQDHVDRLLPLVIRFQNMMTFNVVVQ